MNTPRLQGTFITYLKYTLMQLKNLISLKKDPLELLISLNTLAASLILGELFFKFGSFTLESISFLITWFIIDKGASLLLPKSNRP